jgi:hypothetical protein
LEDIMMKKIFAIAAVALFFSAGSCFAAVLDDGGDVTANPGLQLYGGVAGASNPGVLIGKLSKGVKCGATYGTLSYALTTKHDSGTKGYGTANDSTAIYFLELGEGDLEAPGADDNAAFATGWTAM